MMNYMYNRPRLLAFPYHLQFNLGINFDSTCTVYNILCFSIRYQNRIRSTMFGEQVVDVKETNGLSRQGLVA